MTYSKPIRQEGKRVGVVRVYIVILLVDMASEHHHYAVNSEGRVPILSNASTFGHESLARMSSKCRNGHEDMKHT